VKLTYKNKKGDSDSGFRFEVWELRSSGYYAASSGNSLRTFQDYRDPSRVGKELPLLAA